MNDDLYKLIKFVDVLNLNLAKLVKMEIFKQVILEIKEELKEFLDKRRKSGDATDLILEPQAGMLECR